MKSLHLNCNYLPVEDSSFFENISKIDVRVQEVRIESDGFLEVVDGQPDLALSVEHAAQVAPCDGEVRSGLDGFQVASLLKWVQSGRQGEGEGKRKGKNTLELDL